MAVCLAALSLTAISGLAQRGTGAYHAPGSVALSPDGATVAWTLRSRDGSTLHLTSVSAPASEETDKTIAIPNATGCAYSSPLWSPDGATLAFLAACAPASADPTVPRQSQVYLWSKSTGDVRQLTHVTGDINQPAWSPDGKSIAFLFVENATRTAGALDAMKPWSGVIGEDGVEVQRVYAVNTAADSTSGTGGFLTPANLHVYEFDWAPDSSQIAFIAANPPGENNWWVAKLYVEAAFPPAPATASPAVIFDPDTTHSALHNLQIAVPRWSPDGRRIAFIGGLMSDQGSTGGDVWTIASTGKGEPTDITPNIDGTPCFETWINDHEVGFVEDRSGHTRLVDWNPDAKKEIASTDLGEVTLSGGQIKDAVSTSSNGRLAYTETGVNRPPEIWFFNQGQQAQLTHLNDSVQLHPPRFESIEWDERRLPRPGLAHLPQGLRPGQKISTHRRSSRWPIRLCRPAPRNDVLRSRLLRPQSQPARLLRPG